MSRIAITIVGCFSLIPSAAPPASAPAAGTAVVSPADRATDDALAKLFDTVLAAPVLADGAPQSVAGLLACAPEAGRCDTEDARIRERELRKGVYAEAQIGRSREIKSGVTALEASITAERLSALLSAVLEKRGNSRPQQVRLAPAAGPALFATGTAVDDGRRRSDRPGWRHCEDSDLILSRMAAEQDLRLGVLDYLCRAPLPDRQTVGHLARQQPEIEQSLRKQVEIIAGSEPVFGPEGVCAVTCTLSAGQLTSLVNRAFQAAGLSANDRKPRFTSESVTLQGFGVAPPRPLSTASPIRGPRPEWADRIISKTASAAGPPDEPEVTARTRLATQAARIEAQRQLWMELEELKLPAGTSIAEALAARQNRQTAIEAINGAIFEMSKPSVNDKGVVTITLGLRLATVWEVVGR